MKKFKIFFKMCLFLLASYFVGVALLCIAFLIPDHCLRKQVEQSAETLTNEGLYPMLGSFPSQRLDNFTDTLMISIAGYEKIDGNLLTRAIGDYYPTYNQDDPIVTLNTYIQNQDDVQEASYARYWHGYLVILRSLLVFLNYDGIRTLNCIGVLGTIVILLVAIIKRRSYSLLLPMGLSLFFLRPQVIMNSLQFSSVYYPLMISLILYICFQEWFRENGRYLFLFLLNGIFIAYLDLLTYPVASLGVLLVAVLMLQEDESWLTQTKEVIGASAFWAFGYFGMWSGKWLLSTIILRTNVLADAMGQAKTRMSVNTSEVAAFSRWMVFARNIGAGFLGILVVSGIIALLLGIVLIWSNRMYLRTMMLHMIPYFLICLMPFAWYSVFANHSYIHIFFTYRALAAAVCGWSGMCVQGIRMKKRRSAQC